MNLYIVQHGLSEKNSSGEKVLTESGIEKVKLIGGVAANYKIKVDKIFHSTKSRAKETADVLKKIFEVEAFEIEGLGPKDDVAEFTDKLEKNLMIVGHLPFLNKLVSYLVTGNMDKKIFELQNGGILCLKKDEGKWVIKWGFMPEIN